MARVFAHMKLDMASGRAQVNLELAASTELEHEIVAEFFGKAREVKLEPYSPQGSSPDELYASFSIMDGLAFMAAQRAVENRIRKREGRPSVEEEAAQRLAEEQKRSDYERILQEQQSKLTEERDSNA